ncbi:helix-turn-helix domain-containing protein [Gordonia sp. (in: high G+C Gram-positive bacteria)]|uniref:helix-turn-helix domain-containing protein n=1 Tax=Gordonia sp. (in: high G+C Gram-positive bacteria) TaxID=84139 RepID=UPI003340D1B1
MTKNLNRPEEGAKKLGISRATIYNLLAAGEIKSIKIGRRRFITDDALDAYITRLEEAA